MRAIVVSLNKGKKGLKYLEFVITENDRAYKWLRASLVVIREVNGY